MKSMKFNPITMLENTGVAIVVNKPCPRCGHHTLMRPTMNLVDMNDKSAMPLACCYPGCKYSTSDNQMSLSKLHAKQQEEMEIDKIRNYFDNFSVTADDDDLSKTFDSFKTPTDELKKAKLISERSATDIAKGKTVHSFLIGDTGVGKTHLAYAMINGIWSLNHNCKIIFLNMLQLSILHNKSIHDSNTRKWFDSLFYQIDRADLIILDDLGREQDNNWNKLIVDIVASDRENKSFVITSNANAFKRYSSQTLDRLKEHSSGYAVTMSNTHSYREANA